MKSRVMKGSEEEYKRREEKRAREEGRDSNIKRDKKIDSDKDGKLTKTEPNRATDKQTHRQREEVEASCIIVRSRGGSPRSKV